LRLALAALLLAALIIVALLTERWLDGPRGNGLPPAAPAVPENPRQADADPGGSVAASPCAGASTATVQPPAPAETPARVTEPVPAQAAPSKQAEAARSTAPDAAAAADPVAELYRQQQQPASAPAEAARVESGDSGSRAQPAPESVPVESAIDVEAVLARAREELAEPPLSEHPAPLLATLSQRFKDEVPTILYSRHDYRGPEGANSVVMNGKTVRPGGAVAPGVRLEEILPDSVVLSYRDTRFRLRALNSWVNL
jgi:hypothetical protein